MNWFFELSPIYQALLATLCTWAVTAAGAALVFFAKNISQKYLDASLGMAAGVMIAASFWSLLAPSIEMAEKLSYGPTYKWVPPLIGFLLGAVFLRICDRLLPHIHPGLAVAEGIKTSWQRSTLLVLAITLHNIPEGLAVGVAFGAAAHLTGTAQQAQIGAAIALAIGIGLQNFPEGSAVSLPLRREGMGRLKATTVTHATPRVTDIRNGHPTSTGVPSERRLGEPSAVPVAQSSGLLLPTALPQTSAGVPVLRPADSASEARLVKAEDALPR